MTRSIRVRSAVAMAAAGLILAGCSTLPAAPPALPSTFIPEVSAPSPSPGIPVGADGFNVVERVALRVSVETCNQYRNGSAWVLDENTVVTNRHVVEGAVEIELTSYDGKRYQGTTSVLSDDVDLALVEIDGTFPESATIAAAEPTVAQPVFVVGYPEAGRLTTSPGFYIGEIPGDAGVDTEGAYGINASTKQGNSGSPTVNATGEVIGVVYASDEKSSTVVVGLEALQAFISDTDLQVPNEAECDR